jgi:tRNA 2-(methylsulfanyl)-N6-isopentenyladenosine37 hydroxylase
MLRLKLPTDPRWVNIVEKNIAEILTDHAYCEQKAASNAISIIVKFPEYSELVTAMVKLAQEELEHLNMVHDKITARGLVLGKERKDKYVNQLYDFMKKGGARQSMLTERLLFAALIEARSCERFKVLSENISDPELAAFYHELMISEATHYTMFLGFARKYDDPERVDKRWQEFLNFEAGVIAKLGVEETIHG